MALDAEIKYKTYTFYYFIINLLHKYSLFYLLITTTKSVLF